MLRKRKLPEHLTNKSCKPKNSRNISPSDILCGSDIFAAGSLGVCGNISLSEEKTRVRSDEDVSLFAPDYPFSVALVHLFRYKY